MSLTELIQRIHQLSPEEQLIIRRELDSAQQVDGEETPEMLAAIDEGLRSAREEPLISLEELREEMRTWTLDSK